VLLHRRKTRKTIIAAMQQLPPGSPKIGSTARQPAKSL
jgi:hypothetical protein